MSKKHMTLEDRYTIYHMLNEGSSFKKIADAIKKNCTSISREIKNHLVFKKTSTYSHPFNACVHRKGCPQTSLCSHCIYTIKKRCSFCSKCNSICPDFKEEKYKNQKSRHMFVMLALTQETAPWKNTITSQSKRTKNIVPFFPKAGLASHIRR